jgi:hypothetical protein
MRWFLDSPEVSVAVAGSGGVRQPPNCGSSLHAVGANPTKAVPSYVGVRVVGGPGVAPPRRRGRTERRAGTTPVAARGARQIGISLLPIERRGGRGVAGGELEERGLG